MAGRVSDPSLTLGPAMAHFGWAWDDWDRLARATMAGHLLECGAQVTGGYFADPGFKDVPGLARLGYPIAIIENSGDCTITKPEGTGGLVSERTVKEQLLYEVHDPAAYLTPDVVADLTEAEVHRVGPDAVRLSGVRGHAHNGCYKVNVCHASGWLAEGEISYAGPRALERARLAGEVLRERLGGEAAGDLRLDWIGVASVLGDDAGRWRDARPAAAAPPQDVRLRAAWLRPTQAQAQRLPREVNALYTCGPAGGGGVRTALRARGWARCPACCRRTVSPRAGTGRRRTQHEFLDDGPHRAHGAALPPGPRPHGRQGQSLQHQPIAWNAACWPVLVEQVTEQRVAAHFAARRPARVQRFVLERLQAMNWVLDAVLDGGVNDALNLDSHGKALSYWLLQMPVEVPADLLAHLAPE
ncbi:Protein of uncharacterised function (DUF1446) [Delftia tsuruhatensis]|nr:Protein of uncharacterised function (DUF1446) [Delftia tsuruhatensis]